MFALVLGIRQRAKQKQWQSTETGGRALDDATSTIRTLHVLVDTDSSMLDDSTSHVFTKADIMLIQSEMPEDISKYGHTHIKKPQETLTVSPLTTSICFF